MEDKKKLLGVRVDEEMHKKIKVYTTRNGMTIQEYIMQLIQNDMKTHAKEERG